MSININVNNNWKEASGSYCKVNGVWRKVNKICKNIGGEWKCTGFVNGAVCSKIYYNDDGSYNVTSSTQSISQSKDTYKNCQSIPNSLTEYNSLENIRYKVGETYTGFFTCAGSLGTPDTAFDIDSYNFEDYSSNTPLSAEYYYNTPYEAEGGGTTILFFCKPISDFILIESKGKNNIIVKIIGKFEKLN